MPVVAIESDVAHRPLVKKLIGVRGCHFEKKKRKKLSILNPDQNQLICKATHILTDECLHFVNRGIAQNLSRSDMRNLDQPLLVMTITCGY